jgi:hypothetical protein
VAAAILAGGVLGGAALGSAATNAYNYPTVVTPAAPVAVAPGPSVTVNSTTCYYTHRWVNHVRRRVRVCNGPAVAQMPLEAAPVAAAPAYDYPAAVAVTPAPVVAPTGYCDIVAGNRVCF